MSGNCSRHLILIFLQLFFCSIREKRQSNSGISPQSPLAAANFNYCTALCINYRKTGKRKIHFLSSSEQLDHFIVIFCQNAFVSDAAIFTGHWRTRYTDIYHHGSSHKLAAMTQNDRNGKTGTEKRRWLLISQCTSALTANDLKLLFMALRTNNLLNSKAVIFGENRQVGLQTKAWAKRKICHER